MIKFLGKIKVTKKIILSLAVLGLVSFLFGHFSLAATDGNSLTGAGEDVLQGLGLAVATVLSWIAWVFIMVFGLLLSLFVKILVNVAQFGNIIDVDTVIQGWVIIRDLCNMFFILILLIIAFATILRQENFSAKKLLPKLLIMAVLINFSKSIFGLLIDFSQVIMLTFVNGFAEFGPGNFINMFQTHKILAMWQGAPVNSWGVVVTIMASVITLMITDIVVLVIIAVLVARIVMLWIYTILSPLVFMGFAVPALQKYTGKVWEDFTKQLVVGPVLAFFIWLALTTVSSSAAKIGLVNGTTGTKVCAGIGALFCDQSFQTFIITIGLLMGGLMVAQTMGGAAGSIAGKGLAAINKGGSYLGKAAMLPLLGAKTLAGYGVDKLHEKTGVDLNLSRVWTGVQEKRAENRRRRYQKGMEVAGEAMSSGNSLHGALAMTGAPGDAWQQMTSWKGIKERLRGGKLSERLRGGIDGVHEYEEQKAVISKDIEAEKEKRNGMWTSDNFNNNKDILSDKQSVFVEVQAHIEEWNTKLAEREASLKKNPGDDDYKKLVEEARLEIGELSDQKVGLGEEIKLRQSYNDPKDEAHYRKVVGEDEIKKKDEAIAAKQDELANVKPREGTIMGLEEKRKNMRTAKEAEDNNKEIVNVEARLVRNQMEKARLGKQLKDDDDAIADNKAGGTKKRVFDKEENRDKAEEQFVKTGGIETALKKDIEKRKGLNTTTRIASQSDINDTDAEIKKKKAEMAEYTPIYNFEARALEEKGINEEEAKLKNIDDASELVRMGKDAIKEGDKAKVKAIIRKLTKDYNDNEILEELAGDSGYMGLQKLMRGLSTKGDSNYAGFTQQEAFRLGAQIAEMNKKTNHWEATAAYVMKNGQFREATHAEHVRTASTELGKRGPQANMRDNNRLGSGHHVTDPSTGEKTWNITDIGVIQLQSFDNGRMIGRLAENMTESTAKYFAPVVDKLAEKGLISQALADAVKDKAGLSEFIEAQMDIVENKLDEVNKGI